MSSGRPEASASLPESAIAEILALRPKYPTLEALTLPALHIAQRASGGWLPEAAIEAVAHLLELPVEAVGLLVDVAGVPGRRVGDELQHPLEPDA